MKRIQCEVDYVELQNERGNAVEGVRVVCGECDHEVESFGTSSASIRRCCVMLREECPLDQDNYYIAEDDAE